METFNKVQNKLQERKRYKQKANKINPDFPLRGFLECPQCGRSLTGSASKSKTGKKHYYYHCNPRKGCSVRIRVNDAHSSFMELLDTLAPNKEVCELFKAVLEDKYLNMQSKKIEELNRVEKGLTKVEKDKTTLLEKLLNNTINDATYNSHFNKLEATSRDLLETKNSLKQNDDDLKEFLEFGIYVFRNLKILFQKASVTLQQKMLSSILQKKLVFQDREYRTPEFKAGFQHIYQNINTLKAYTNKKGKLSNDNFPLSTRDGT